MHIFLVLMVLSVSSDFPFQCSEYVCPSYYQFDGACETVCMNPSCNYDSGDYTSDTFLIRFFASDCFSSCYSSGCDPSLLGNSVCDSSCNSPECGYDLGDCGYCASGCTIDLLTNSICDPVCNVPQCMYDNNACGWCAENCFQEDLSSSTACISACDNAACDYQNLVCNAGFCSPNCSPEMQNSGYCYYDCYI